MIKNIHIYFYSIALILIVHSCKQADKEIPPDDHPSLEESALKFVFNSKQVKLFQKIQYPNVQSALKEIDIEKYFGDYYPLLIPEEILVKKDSVVIVKQFGVIEKYRSKRDKNNLYIETNFKDPWVYLGSMKNNNVLLMNLSLYSKNGFIESGSALVLGHGYGLGSYEKIFSKANKSTSLIWLQFDLLYIKSEK